VGEHSRFVNQYKRIPRLLNIRAAVVGHPLPILMLSSPWIGEGTAYREIMEGLGLPIAWGMEGELGVALADTLSNSEEEHCKALPL